MDSPPSVSNNSEAPMASEDSGLVANSGSFSSDSASGWRKVTSLPDDDKSLCLSDSGECSDSSDTSSEMNFNTMRKRISSKDQALMDSRVFTAIDPPTNKQEKSRDDDMVTEPIAQPSKLEQILDTDKGPVDFAMSIRYASTVFKPVAQHAPTCNIVTHKLPKKKKKSARSYTPPMLGLLDRCVTPDNVLRPPCIPRVLYSPSPVSSSRLSISHNSLNKDSINQLDDSNLVSEAVSVDNLVVTTMPEAHNAPFTSEIYSLPVDSLPLDSTNNNLERPKNKNIKKSKKRGHGKSRDRGKSFRCYNESCVNKALSLPGPSTGKNDIIDSENKFRTNRDMKKNPPALNSSSSDSDSESDQEWHRRPMNRCNKGERDETPVATISNGTDESLERDQPQRKKGNKRKSFNAFTTNLKRVFCNLFRWRRNAASDTAVIPPPIAFRALPPLPDEPAPRREASEQKALFASSLETVKDCGWYWGAITVAEAEKILCNEPDGSFIVRDSSDHHYIFTLTFKLHGMRHVRIEHDHGNFGFRGCNMFKSQTIVEFIENAVDISRGGRYLFFLNLRPVLGPVRVQLLHPVSRFTHIQRLQHLCRYVILRHVRRDLLAGLPLPRRLIDYLNAPQYVTEF